MNTKTETIQKFLTALHVDSVKDVKYVGKKINGVCVCGQPITYCYEFKNIRNNMQCVVGERCLKYVLEYIRI